MLNLIIGLVGMFLILIAFILEEFEKKFTSENIYYNFLNLLGSLLLIIYAYTLRGWPFLILNGVWFLAASVKTIEILRKH